MCAVRAVHDGRGHARRAAPSLGHHLRRRGAALRVSRHRLPDDGADGDRRPRRGRRRGDLPRHHRRLDLLRQASSTPGRHGAWTCAKARRRRRCPRAIPGATAASASADSSAPGTFVLAMVFLVSFVLYYFVNWKYLSHGLAARDEHPRGRPAHRPMAAGSSCASDFEDRARPRCAGVVVRRAPAAAGRRARAVADAGARGAGGLGRGRRLQPVRRSATSTRAWRARAGAPS